MIGFFLSAAMLSAAPEPCAVPDSMPAPSEQFEGAGDADWCLAGEDPFALAGPDLQPGRQWQVKDGDGRIVLIQWRRAVATLPDPWRAVEVVPATGVTTDFHEILIQPLADTLIVVTVNPAWRIGNAICAGEGGVQTAYHRDGAALTDEDRAALKHIASADRGLDPGNVMCTQLTRTDGGYRANFHGPQGRPLYEIDGFYEETRFRPVPLGNVVALLGVSR